MLNDPRAPYGWHNHEPNSKGWPLSWTSKMNWVKYEILERGGQVRVDLTKTLFLWTRVLKPLENEPNLSSCTISNTLLGARCQPTRKGFSTSTQTMCKLPLLEKMTTLVAYVLVRLTPAEFAWSSRTEGKVLLNSSCFNYVLDNSS